MKHLVLFTCLIALTIACNSGNNQLSTNDTKSIGNFGTMINEKGSMTMAQLVAEMKDKPEMNVKVEGKISDCCQKKGCWMNIEKGDGTEMKVTFKDYGFFVPKDCKGKTTIFQGRAFMDTVTVEMLRHYAEDAGKSEEEIAKINEPSTELTFEAEGVIIK